MEGYKFTGWYTNKACTEEYKWDFENDYTRKDMILYAGWTKNDEPISTGGGGGGGNSNSVSTYAVTAGKTENGSVAVSTEKADEGQTVTITVTPDSGYTLEALTVKDANGKEIALTAVEVGKTYTFTMPSSNVSVEASFVKEETEVPEVKVVAKAIKKLTKGTKSFTVTWTKASKTSRQNITGYQIRYSTSKKFDKTVAAIKYKTVNKNTATNVTVKKLKKNTKYYVQLRTYKTVDGVKYYSAWSKTKSIKTK